MLLAIAVVGGTAYGYQQWQDDIAAATATDTTNPTVDDDAGEPDASPTAETSGDADPDADDRGDDDGRGEEKGDPYVSPTFDVLEPTDGREQPVVLLVGDGYADGRGASSAGTSYASLLAKGLDWDVRLATAPGAGYVAVTTLTSLFLDAPASVDPDLVIVQGGYGGDAPNDEVRDIVRQLDASIRERFPDAELAAVTPFWPGTPNGQSETRERTVARAWREDPDALVLRPQPEGWSTFATVNRVPQDAGHELIATAMIDAFRAAGLAPVE